jgi:hypothetical protein
MKIEAKVSVRGTVNTPVNAYQEREENIIFGGGGGGHGYGLFITPYRPLMKCVRF